MPRREPHPLALFSLIPGNDRACDVLDHPNNIHLVSLIPEINNARYPDGLEHGLNIGLHIGSSLPDTLASLGSGGADITVEGASISNMQCSFEIHKESRKVVLRDLSIDHSTQVCGKRALPFGRQHTPRRVVVDRDLNCEFGFGGARCDLVRFKIHWHKCASDLGRQIGDLNEKTCIGQTSREIPNFDKVKRATRIHVPGNQGGQMRYRQLEKIGSGSYGKVYKVIDVDSGQFLAVKRITWSGLELDLDQYGRLKREVETLARISHPNIIAYISKDLRKTHLDLFTELKDGDLYSLVLNNPIITDSQSAITLLHQMLQALDYLAYNSIIHRDVKPRNILYTKLPAGEYSFHLTDFGVCNIATNARTYAGTEEYMAPEAADRKGAPQTCKMDVWSLFATFAFAVNLDGYRAKPLLTLA